MNTQTTPMNKALIAMAVYNTAENKKFEVTKRTIDGLINSGIHLRHDLYIIDNGSHYGTITYIMSLPKEVTKIFNGANIGTARAINKAWQFRKEGQHAIKMDDDVLAKAFWIMVIMIKPGTRNSAQGYPEIVTP